jgi:hypothetical protein
MTPLSVKTTAVLQRIFAPENYSQAISMLEEGCGNNLPDYGSGMYELERVRFAALKLSLGNLHKLSEAIKLAQVDWRDLLMGADFAESSQAHEDWAAKTLGAAM